MSAALRSVPRGEESRCRAITPLTPLRNSTRWPTSGSAPKPPMRRIATKPRSSTWVAITPISSMWPTSAHIGPPLVPATRAKLEPSVSPHTSANGAAAARQTAVARSSEPDGAGAVSKLEEQIGNGQGGGAYLDDGGRTPTLRAMSPVTRSWAWFWRHERGGSLRLS